MKEAFTCQGAGSSDVSGWEQVCPLLALHLLMGYSMEELVISHCFN